MPKLKGPGRTFMRREDRSFFHAWIADSRKASVEAPNVSKQTTFQKTKQNRITLFMSDQEDGTRTNMPCPGMFPSDSTMQIKELAISARFTDNHLLADFIRGGIVTLSVGDKPQAVLPAMYMADPATLQTLLPEDGKPEGLKGFLRLRRTIAVPPRQGVHATLEVPRHVADQFSAIEAGLDRREYAEVRVELNGRHSSYVYENDLSPEELEEALKEIAEHEERIRRAEYENPPGMRWGLSHEEASRLIRQQLKEKHRINDDYNAEYTEIDLDHEKEHPLSEMDFVKLNLGQPPDGGAPGSLYFDDDKGVFRMKMPSGEWDDAWWLHPADRMLDEFAEKLTKRLITMTGAALPTEKVREALAETLIEVVTPDDDGLMEIGSQIDPSLPEEWRTAIRDESKKYLSDHIDESGVADAEVYKKLGDAAVKVTEARLVNKDMDANDCIRVFKQALGLPTVGSDWSPDDYLK